MNKLYISPRKDSPEISLDPVTGLFSISGISHPENISILFEPVLEWLDSLKVDISRVGVSNYNFQKIQLEFFFIYINSATYKYLVTFILKIREFQEIGMKLEIKWYYECEDIDMCSAGTELIQYIGLPDVAFSVEERERVK